MTANVYTVSLGMMKKFLKSIAVLGIQLCKLYTLNKLFNYLKCTIKAVLNKCIYVCT